MKLLFLCPYFYSTLKQKHFAPIQTCSLFSPSLSLKASVNRPQLVDVYTVACLFISVGNPLLLNSSMQPDITVGQTYSSPICFQDSIDKELFDPLPDIKVKVQSSFMVSLGVADRAEYHVKAHPETFPRGLDRDCHTMDGRKRNLTLLSRPGAVTASKSQPRTTGVFGHLGGRLVVPNTGELDFFFFFFATT